MFKKMNFRKSLVLSVGVHILFCAVLLVVFLVKNLTHPVVTNNDIQVELISPTVAEAPTTQKAEKKKSIQFKKQIVEQDPTQASEVKPEDAKFLSEKNQIVKKQTVAKNRGDFENKKTMAQPIQGDPFANDKNEKSNTKDKTALKNLLPQMDAYDSMQKQVQKQAESGGGRKGEWKVKSASNADSSKTNDYLKDLDQGMETQLNTKEFKYFSYYNRIRKQLSLYWEPKVRDKVSKMFKQGRMISSDADRITRLLIVLNDAGLLVKVQLVSQSGIHDLDDAAVEAFRAAAPFPNPPKGIIEADGTVKIDWSFVLEV